MALGGAKRRLLHFGGSKLAACDMLRGNRKPRWNPGYNLVPGDHCFGASHGEGIQDESISSNARLFDPWRSGADSGLRGTNPGPERQGSKSRAFDEIDSS